MEPEKHEPHLPVEGFVSTDKVEGIQKEKPSRPHIAFKQAVAERLADSGPKVREAVVGLKVTEELDKRQKAAIAVITKLEAADKDLKKAQQAGNVVFDHESRPVGSPTFSKQQVEDMKKLREQIAKLEGALTKALEGNDWQKLFEVAGQ